MTAGDEYIRQVTAHAADRRARSAFQRLALSATAPGARIYDFGAGPGIDARFYATHGRLVDAYDMDPRMRETFADHCRQEIESGRVRLHGDDDPAFIEGTASPTAVHADVVTANFAPLNLIDDPHALFERFHRITAPAGRVLLSVLNPHYLGDLRYLWWWRHVPELWQTGSYSVKGETFNIYRRTTRNLAQQAAPYFSLEQVLRGLPARALLDNGPLRRPSLLTSRYLFLVFSRRA